MLDAREMRAGRIRGRQKQQHPHLSNQELDLKALEEVERVQKIHSRPGCIRMAGPAKEGAL